MIYLSICPKNIDKNDIIGYMKNIFGECQCELITV